MKKLLGIVVLGLLFISIDLSNPTKVKAVTFGELTGIPKMSKTEKILHKLNPLNYFEKRKECQRGADTQDTVAMGKSYFKSCMDD